MVAQFCQPDLLDGRSTPIKMIVIGTPQPIYNLYLPIEL